MTLAAVKSSLEQGSNVVHMVSTAQKIAAEVFSTVWKKEGFPVDPITIARRLGIQVLETDLPENVSGALFQDKGKDPIIVIHEADSDQRKRFTCAHELGHYFLRLQNPEVADDEYNHLDLRDDNSTKGTNLDEVFANEFAANLLMPKEHVKGHYNKYGSRLRASLLFGVSELAMTYRLKNLGLIS